MGSASSKVAKTAANAAKRRQYPSRVPLTSTPSKTTQGSNSSAAKPGSTGGPMVHPAPEARENKDETISLDARDPDFAASLRSLGPVQPNSTLSNTSTFRSRPSSSSSSGPSTPHQQNDPSPPPPQGQNIFPDPSQNPALAVLEARTRIAEEAEKEFTHTRSATDTARRRFLDVGTIRQVLTMRDEKGMTEQEIEKSLRLQAGVVGKLALFGEARVAKRGKEDSGIYD